MPSKVTRGEDLRHLRRALELAHKAGLSTSRFHARFLHELGCSPMGYLKKVHLEFAARLLARDNHKLSHVAERSRFRR